MTRVLVTGGAGFLGSHLCDRLVEAGHRVICIDNLCTGRMANIAHLVGSERFEFIERDITEKLELDVQQIYNLACPASPPKYQRDPVQTMRTNVIGALNVLELAAATGARVVHASTSEVYGDPIEHPQRESYRGHVNPVGPRACYNEGKRCAETLMADYHRHRGVDTRVARIFNTYGPRMDPDDGRVVSNLIVQALAGEPLTIYGDGTQTRSFCYVDDLIDGLVRLMAYGGDGAHFPINLGNPEEISILDLARSVRSISSSPSAIARLEGIEDDPRQRRPDIGRARGMLDWRPLTDLADGLPLTIDYFDSLS